MNARVWIAIVVLGLLAGSNPGGALAQAETDWPTAGWDTATPEEKGVDPGLLAEADARIPAELPNVSALLVVRGGAVVFERSYGGYDPADPLDVRSVTKSVVGTLVGIAVGDGALALDDTVGDLIPERIPTGADPRVAAITVGSLLTMTSGLAWDAGSDYQTLIASRDWVGLTLGLPVAFDQGAVYAYNTGGSHLLSVILSAVTGQDTAAYAEERLFGPLGIEPGRWRRSPQGETNGGFGLNLTPRDMAKLGYLYLNGGRWDGDQLVPEDYVRRATAYQSAGDATGGTPYGFQWWVTEATGYAAFYALGYGGQYIYAVPALDLVVVMAAERRVPPAELRSPRWVIEGLVVPAAV